MTITLAFYKGRGKTLAQRLQDKAIRLATRGIYSHVEMIAGAAAFGRSELCLSSSMRDGGVRQKPIVLKPAHWDLVAIEIGAGASVGAGGAGSACDFIRHRMGAPYDYTGILLSQVLALGRHNPDKWFCSEICAAAFGLPDPQRVSPQFLFDVVTWRAGAPAIENQATN